MGNPEDIMPKKVILDKADRLYHYPLDLEEYFPKWIKRKPERKLPRVDLGHFRWPVQSGYASTEAGAFRQAGDEELNKLKVLIAEWYKSEFNISVDPDREVYLGQGIRRILCDLCLAFIEDGDIVLCPEPGIPFYKRQVITAGGVPITYQISEKTNFKPSYKQLTTKLGRAAKIIMINNPHNPLGTVLDHSDLSELVRIASLENLFIVVDAAYSSLSEEKYIPLLGIRGGKKVALEMYSFSYTFGLPYIPFGFAIGSPEAIHGLKLIHHATGIYIPSFWIDLARQEIEDYPSEDLRKVRKDINQARVEAVHMADKFGWRYIGGKSAPFIWTKNPGRRHSSEYANILLRRKNILVLPGNAFGETGEGYTRLSLTASPDDYRVAVERMSKTIGFGFKAEE